MSNKKPLIGLTPLVDEARDSYWMLRGYMDVLKLAGGVPMMLPLTDDDEAIGRIADAMDGFVITGGPDVAPELYGQEKRPECGEAVAGRDALESRLILAALERKKPILGICRGLQMINVMLGGTLYQDLVTQHPSPVSHRMKPPYDRVWHEVHLIGGTPLEKLLGKTVTGVNSCHHQAIDKLGEGLAPMAMSPDGLIEAVYMPGYPFLWATQWHPEFSYKVNPESVEIIRAFVCSMMD